MITVNAHQIGLWQRCKRPYLISRTHKYDLWRPQSLLAACMRLAILNLSNGKSLEDVQVTATNNFLSYSRTPGLDVHGIDTYTLAMDYCSIMRNVLEYLSRLTLLNLVEIPPIQISPSVTWQFLACRDESGILHRWDFIPYLPDKDGIITELHQWDVFGDVAAYDSPMQLHLVAIGQRNGCHQASPWCRIYSHPRVANIFRFQKRSGTQLEGEWKPLWFAGSKLNNSKTWVDLMERDNVIETLVKHVNITQVTEQDKKNFLRDILYETSTMQATSGLEPRDVPMSRYACDHPFICPHQQFCYSSLGLDEVGVYIKKSKEERKNAPAPAIS